VTAAGTPCGKASPLRGNQTSWQIEQGCPQCGAPVTLEETDRLLACPFCRTRLYLVPEGHFRYHIPLAARADGELLYIPYWRLRGSAFTVTATGVICHFVDANAIAADISCVPPTLGLRPQVLKLRFDSPTTEGRFIPADRPALQAVPDQGETPQAIFYRGFIGETVSLIHAPMLLRGETLYDGILGRAVAVCDFEGRQRLLVSSAAPSGQALFIPTLCPHCGWDMEGERDSLVLLCRNCDSAWACPGRTFARVEYTIITMPSQAGEIATYLPFWRMTPRFEGLDLASWADLIRIANLPKAITAAFEEALLYFWSPAFKVNPALLARWARQMTVFRPEGDEVDRLPRTSLHPVTLSLAEAAEGMVINLAQMIVDKRKHYPKLANLRVTLDESRLEYHPFVLSHSELIHATMKIAIDRTALAYGFRM
jgi:DNA-directed RNA polymerase subunit RPC12/RpoP